MAAFEVGDRVVARVSAQGLKEGRYYTISHVQRARFGTVQYLIRRESDNAMLTIINGHIILGKVSVADCGHDYCCDYCCSRRSACSGCKSQACENEANDKRKE